MAGIRHRAARHPRLCAAARTCLAACVVVAFAVAGCVRARPAEAQPPLPVTLAVATWNLHGGRGDLARFQYELASGVLTDGVPADYVILLQEDVEPAGPAAALPPTHTARVIAEQNGLSYFRAPVRGNAHRTTGNAMLSTRALLNPHVVTLEQERQPRSAITATIRLDAASLFIVNVHMENRVAWWRALFSDTARGEQATALLRQLPATGDGILGGDLNTWLGPNEPAWRAMLKRFPDTPRESPQPTFHDRLVLDHLFFDLPDGWSVTRRVSKDAYGSDHHPVIAVVTNASVETREHAGERCPRSVPING